MLSGAVRHSRTLAVLGVAAALSACQSAGVSPPRPAATAAAPTIPVDPLIGRWGLAAYHRDTDRPRTEKEAHAQCANAYVIAKGPTGGVMMHLADEAQPTELVLKTGGGKTWLGPPGVAPMAEDREIVTLEPKTMVMRFADPEVAARYGTSIYVRCS